MIYAVSSLKVIINKRIVLESELKHINNRILISQNYTTSNRGSKKRVGNLGERLSRY